MGCCGQYSQKLRTGIFTVLLLFNFYALVLTVYANLAASDQVSVLKRANFAQGVVFFQTDQIITTVRAYVGLKNIVMRDLGGVLGTEAGETLYTWDEFCGNFTGDGRVEAFADESTCQDCADASEGVGRLLAFSILFSLPMIATNVLRRFPNYDVRAFLFVAPNLRSVEAWFPHGLIVS